MENASAAGFGLDCRIRVTIEGKLQKTYVIIGQRGQWGRVWCPGSPWGAGGCIVLLWVLAAPGPNGAGWS
jgi:hypothetical protein